MIQRENALLGLADVVFTGGLSLYRSKRQRFPAAHCFPSSVDAAHFQRALSEPDHSLQRELPRPRLGFFGVIDERLDLELVAALADARPQWQLVMVGPHVKIDPRCLPQRANIHYMGQQPYAALPAFLAGWDVCLQPFALCESTRYISPTKTLEYMAAERPIVSTPIADVVASYGSIVRIAGDAPSFIEACERALNESATEREQRITAMRDVLSRTSWDQTASQMHAAIVERVQGKATAARPSPTVNLQPALTATIKAPVRKYRAIVIGAGPTGLSAGYHLGADSLVLEKEGTVGGWCRSIEDRGFTFDYAGHIMFSNDPYVHQLYRQLLGDNVHWQDREAWIYSKQVFTRYPFQGALYGLPPDVLKDCIVGAIESRFGRLKEPAATPAIAVSGSHCKAESITDCCADGVAESTVPVISARGTRPSSAEPRNFEEFIYKVWGAGVAKHFAVPYNRKLWALPLAEMETSWLGGRVPMPDLEDMIDGALRPVAKPQGPNARFGYPLHGGFQALVNGFLPMMAGDLMTGAAVVKVDAAAHVAILADGNSFGYRKLVSTAPLPQLLTMLGDDVPADVLAAARRLRHVSVRCVNLGVGRANISDKHWIYYPEDTVFHRIFLQGNASPHCNAPGGFALTCEITYSSYKPLPCDGDALIDRCIEDCIRVGLIRADDPIVARNQVDMPYAYVVYDHGRRENVRIIRDWLDSIDIVLAGRYSEWEYYNSDHAFIAGKRAAESVLAPPRSEAAAEAAAEVS
jgi:protoporphyrinogen oxidase